MKPAIILAVNEIKSQLDDLDGQPIRTWGRISSLDIENSMMTIAFNGQCLDVSTELIVCFDGKIGDTIQIIGDVDGGKIRMKSFQNTPEMDVKLFEEVLMKRRQFMESESIR